MLTSKAASRRQGLKQRLAKFPGLAELAGATADALATLLVPRTFEAGSFLLRAGQAAEWSFLIERGLVREFYLAEGGQEHVRAFVAEQGATGSLLDLISKSPAVTWIQALEQTETLALRYAEFEELCDRAPDLQRFALRFSQQVYVRKARREHDMLALSARQRLVDWQREQPGLDARIRRQHLASYLGITPEHLSRLTTRK
ncbi:MAG: hypothetical protein JWN04_1886 [Myxococcaceae bacterium]|nr:hypothetical protein [Myxococcaceae bacterium]